jgi:opacity protein-like surface antigen
MQRVRPDVSRVAEHPVRAFTAPASGAAPSVRLPSGTTTLESTPMLRPSPPRARQVSRTLPVLLAALVLAASSASAQQRAPRALSVGVGGGGTVPIGDFANDVKTGWNALGFFQYQPVAEGPWAVRAEALYTRAGYTDDFLADVGATPDDDLRNSVLYVGASALYHVSAGTGVRPYVMGGLGLYELTASLTDGSGISTSDSESGFGFNGGVGLRFGGPVAFFVEARFHQFSITPTDGAKSTSRFIPVTLGFSF